MTKPITTVLSTLVLAAYAAALLVLPQTASAMVLKMTLPEMVRTADSVVVARVMRQSQHINGPMASARPKVYTDSNLKVERVLRGSRPANIMLSQLGGTFDGNTLVVDELPKLSPGERLILFLDAQGSIVGGYQGKLDIVGSQVPQLGLSLADVISAIRAGGVVPGAKATSGLTTTTGSDLAVSGVVATSISAITPQNANAGTGERIHITGSGFGSSTGTVMFTDGVLGTTNVPATIVSWSDTGIVCTVPSGDSGVESGNVNVKRADATNSASVFYNVGFSTTGLKWHDPSVSYLVNPNCPNVSPAATLAAIQAAMGTWNASETSFRYNYSGSTSLSAGTEYGDGVNEIFWSNDSPGYGYLAWNSYWYDPATKAISESDIVFSNTPAGHLWYDGASPSTIDIQSVALHELGHTLQINDQYSNTNKVMGALVTGTTRRVLTQNEKDGARYFNDWPTTPAVTSSTHPTQGTWYATPSATLNFSATGPTAVNGYSYLVDNSPVTVPDTVAEGSATTYNANGLSTGDHWFHVRARRTAASPLGDFWGLTAHYRLRIDATAPAGSVQIGSPVTSTVTSRLVSIDSAFTDAGSGLSDMRVDAGSGWSPWTAYASHYDAILPATDGTYTVSVQYRDQVGNVTDPVSRAFTLVVAPPGSVIESSAVSVNVPATLGYGATTTVSGMLIGEVSGPVLGATVSLEAMPYGSAGFVRLAQNVTAASGRYSFAVKPSVRTSYRVVFSGDATHRLITSVTRTVLPAAWASTPIAPSYVSRARYYTVYGYLKPAHAAGTSSVRVYRWRWNGASWVSYGFSNAKVSSYYSLSKYVATLRFPYAGRWRVRAYHADAAHAASWSSGYDYVTSK